MNCRPFAADVRNDKSLTVLMDAIMQFELYPGKAEVAGISIFIGIGYRRIRKSGNGYQIIRISGEFRHPTYLLAFS